MQVSHTMGIEFSFALSVVDDPTDILDDTVRVYSCLVSIYRDLLHPVSYTHLTLPTIYSV